VPLVLAAAVPLLIAMARGGELMSGFRHRMTEAERRRNYLYILLSGKDAAKELRAFGVGASCASATTGCTTSTWPSCARWPGAGIVASLLVLALSGRIGLADAGTAAAAVFVLGERLMNAAFSSGMLYEPSLFIEDFTSFVAMAPRSRRAGSPLLGRSSATPRSSSSTSRPRPSTPGPSTSCSGASGPCAGAGRCC
jgi:ATP-binding cassette, subfamily B, bacterial